MTGAAAMIVAWKVSDADRPLWSSAVIFTVQVAGAIVVPVMVWVVALKLSPLGSPLAV